MPDEPARRPARSRFVAWILAAMILGGVLGQLAHRAPTEAGAAAPAIDEAWRGLRSLCLELGTLGSLVVGMIKGLAGPLLYFAIVDAFLRSTIRGRKAATMLGISAINACFALAIGLTLSNLIRPGRFLRFDPLGGVGGTPDRFAVADRPLDFLDDLLGFVPTNVLRPVLENTILSIVILAVLSGAALRKVKAEQRAEGFEDYLAVEAGVSTVYRAIGVALRWIIALIPAAVFAVVAATVAERGLEPIIGLSAYVGVAVLGLALQVALVYQGWIVLVARRSLGWFWAGAREALAYAVGASSSLATLPVTLRCLERMGVSASSARMSACVGTNFNNDGILLYEAMAVLFVAQAYGIELAIGQQLVAAISCVVAGIGIAGVPEAGLISLALVLSTVGLPLDILPLLLTVDWVLSRCRATTNVTCDILVAVLLDRLVPERGGPVDELPE